ncbi:hypothetical protein ACU4GD_07725 [Cupriavidus basilensis]
MRPWAIHRQGPPAQGWSPRYPGRISRCTWTGYNQLDYLTGKSPKGARDDFYYFNDDGELGRDALRRLEDRLLGAASAGGHPQVWANPFTCLQGTRRSSTSAWIRTNEPACRLRTNTTTGLPGNAYLTEIGVTKAAAFLETFVTYPPSQKPASFSVDQIRKSVDERIEKQRSPKK